MNCLKCGSDTKVLESRLNESNSVRRRRMCLACGERFTTMETVGDHGYVAPSRPKAAPKPAKKATPEQIKERNRKRQENWKRAETARDTQDDYWGESAPDHLEYSDLKEYL
jgi:hypothetical protein